MAASADATLTSAAGYAIPGGIFFLISALRLGVPKGSPRT
jgi:hypothetical protein